MGNHINTGKVDSKEIFPSLKIVFYTENSNA